MARILVVEDMDDLRDALCDVLRVSGHDVLGATDGRDALTKLQGQDVDVILLDLHMPIMDGPRFLEERARTSHASVPVIILSAWADRRVVDGAFAQLTKPVQIGQLLDVVRQATFPKSEARRVTPARS